MHLPPSTSTQLQSAYFSLPPTLCIPLNVIRTKTLDVIGQFPQIYAKKLKVVRFDSKLAHLVSWKCWFQIWTLDFWNSSPKIHFWENLGQKNQSCLFCLKTDTHGISRMLILIPTLVFWIVNPKSIFGQIWVFWQKKWKLSVLPEMGKFWPKKSKLSESAPPRYHLCQYSIKTEKF